MFLRFLFIHFFIVYLFVWFFTEILHQTYSCVMIYYCNNFVFIYNNAICIFRFIIMNKKLQIKNKKNFVLVVFPCEYRWCFLISHQWFWFSAFILILIKTNCSLLFNQNWTKFRFGCSSPCCVKIIYTIIQIVAFYSIVPSRQLHVQS